MTDETTIPHAPLRIAVVIPCYNAENWIDRAISSVLGQGYDNLVLIVVDDGSTDGSAARVGAFSDRVLLQSGPNRGANHARNRGTDLARQNGATHILFLDADDYHEGALIAGAADLAAATGADLVLSDMHIEYPADRREERFLYSGQVAPEAFFDGWMHGHIFHPAAILWRLDFLDRVGDWDESLMQAQDTDICLRAMFSKPLIMKNGQGASIYTQDNPASLSRNVSRKSTEDRITVLARLIQKVPGTDFEDCRKTLLWRLYSVTRDAFRAGQADLGRRGLQELYAAGFHDNPGSRMHRLLANLFGLETKVRLWGN